jgi:hypothetical protein
LNHCFKISEHGDFFNSLSQKETFKHSTSNAKGSGQNLPLSQWVVAYSKVCGVIAVATSSQLGLYIRRN